MIELAQLFQDVEAAVIQHEPAVEEIEQKAEATHENVGKANVEIDGAISKARSRRRKQWWCLGILCTFFFFFILHPSFGHKRRSLTWRWIFHMSTVC